MISSLIEWPHRSTCHHPSRHNRGEATGTWIPRQIEDIPSIISIQSASNSLIALNDWAYLIDHTVQIGTVKCFAVVGVRLSQLPYPSRCLQRQDLVLIALTPMQHSTAITVKQALEQADLRTGVPRLIVSDEGGDVRGGIEQYCGDHPHTSS